MLMDDEADITIRSYVAQPHSSWDLWVIAACDLLAQHPQGMQVKAPCSLLAREHLVDLPYTQLKYV